MDIMNIATRTLRIVGSVSALVGGVMLLGASGLVGAIPVVGGLASSLMDTIWNAGIGPVTVQRLVGLGLFMGAAHQFGLFSRVAGWLRMVPVVGDAAASGVELVDDVATEVSAGVTA